MKRLEQLVSALTPKRWPVRWRLAAVSAVLTFLILVIFALVVGRAVSIVSIEVCRGQDIGPGADPVCPPKG